MRAIVVVAALLVVGAVVIFVGSGSTSEQSGAVMLQAESSRGPSETHAVAVRRTSGGSTAPAKSSEDLPAAAPATSEVEISSDDDLSSAKESSNGNQETARRRTDLLDDMKEVDSLPIERQWTSQYADLEAGGAKSILEEAERFDAAIKRMQKEARDNPFAWELEETYRAALEAAVSNDSAFDVSAFACGVRTCLGEFAAPEPIADWLARMMSTFSAERFGPETYAMFFVGPSDGQEPFYRFLFSTDPESNGIVVFPRRFMPP